MSHPYQQDGACSSGIIMAHPIGGTGQLASLSDLTDLLNEVEIADEAIWQNILDRVAAGAPIELPAVEALARSRRCVDPYHRVRYHR